jgi:hypothetical protein
MASSHSSPTWCHIELRYRHGFHFLKYLIKFIYTCRDSSVGRVTAYGLDGRGSFPGGARDISPFHSVQSGSAADLASYPMGTGGSFHGGRVKRLRREADHSPQSSAEVQGWWSYTSTPPHVFIAWQLITGTASPYFLPVELCITDVSEAFPLPNVDLSLVTGILYLISSTWMSSTNGNWCEDTAHIFSYRERTIIFEDTTCAFFSYGGCLLKLPTFSQNQLSRFRENVNFVFGANF